MFLLLNVLARVPVLLGNSRLSWVDASLASFHVAVDLDGILVAALVRVNPVLACVLLLRRMGLNYAWQYIMMQNNDAELNYDFRKVSIFVQ